MAKQRWRTGGDDIGLTKGPSETAILAAVGRALHRTDPAPRVLDDQFAIALAGEKAPSVMDRLRREMPADLLLAFSRWTAVRTRFAEDQIAEALETGVTQVVILGAGLDSFAHRHPDLPEHIRTYEVDHPSSQEWKRERIERLGRADPSNLTYVPVDFEVKSWREGLGEAGFAFNAPAIFTWIGVSMYLTLGAIKTTLNGVADCAPETTIVFTYDLPRKSLDARGLALTNGVRKVASEMGEPFISLFDPKDAEDLARECGLGHPVHFGPEEAIRQYFEGRPDIWVGGPQRILTCRSPYLRRA